MSKLIADSLETPLGMVRICASAETQEQICFLDFADNPQRMELLLSRRFGRTGFTLTSGQLEATTHLRAYFSGDVTALDALAVSPGGTPFQLQLWRGLREIPVGTTLTYGALAARLGRPGGARAVGMACNSNQIGIVIPCHRVIGARGALTGYAAGIDRKRWLLEHERAQVAAA